MRLKNIVIICCSVTVLSLVLFLKLFTAEVTQKGDPSVALVIKPMPSLENRIALLENENIFNYTVLLFDENRFTGESLYHALNNGLWILFSVVAGALIVFSLRRGRG